MRNGLYLLAVFAGYQVAVAVISSTQSPSLSTKPSHPNKLITAQAACTSKVLMAIILTQNPFHGLVYARGYPIECKAEGNGSREIRFTVGVNQCGTKITQQQDGSLLYESLVYVQYDKHVQQATDDQLLLRCSPQEIRVTGSFGTSSTTTTVQASTNEEAAGERRNSTAKPGIKDEPIETWMDFMSGRMPQIKPIQKHVNVGDEVTMLIKIRQRANIMTKVTDCYAHDGSQVSRQDLTDENGCSLDESVFPNMEESTNSRTRLKVIYTTFNVFKFPDRSSLHIQCNVLVCNHTCQTQPCGKSFSAQRSAGNRLSETEHEHHHLKTPPIKQIHVFNSLKVKAPGIEEVEGPKSFTDSNNGDGIYETDIFCLTSLRMVLIVVVFIITLLASLITSVCLYVRTRELRKQLVENKTQPPPQFFPYGRFVDCT